MTTDTQSSGQVFDIGYQHYTGTREGRVRARKSIYLDGCKNALGIGRGGWAKFLPWLLIGPTIMVGLVFAAIAAFFSQTFGDIAEAGGEAVLDLPSHTDLYAATVFIILLFAAVMGPELLCPDRRQGVIHLYLVRPITLIDYLGTRWCAFATITFFVALIPQVTLFAGIMFGVPDLPDYISDNWADIPRFVGMSALLAVFATSFTFAMASLTTRRMIATLIVMAIFIVSSTAVELFLELTNLEDLEDWIRLLDLSGLHAATLNQIVFGEYDADGNLSAFIPLAWYAILSISSILATWRIYVRLT